LIVIGNLRSGAIARVYILVYLLVVLLVVISVDTSKVFAFGIKKNTKSKIYKKFKKMAKKETNLSVKLDLLIERIKKVTGLDISQIEEKLGYAKGRIGQAKSKGQVTEKFLNYIQNSFTLELYQGERGNVNEPMVNYGAKGESFMQMQAILNLTNSNKVLAESQKVMATIHSDLVELVKKSECAAEGSPVTDLAKFSDLLEVIADVASGKRYKSKQEALAELNKYVAVASQKKK